MLLMDLHACAMRDTEGAPWRRQERHINNSRRRAVLIGAGDQLPKGYCSGTGSPPYVLGAWLCIIDLASLDPNIHTHRYIYTAWE